MLFAIAERQCGSGLRFKALSFVLATTFTFCGIASADAGVDEAAPLESENVVVDHSLSVIQSENDQRDYQYVTLANGLRVLLVSDPSTEKAAAALDVDVGSGDDPRDREGLAHFLEHMLFLGTEKYPESDDYQQFIAQHGGSHNAYTSSEHTNYFFDVEASYLEPALDRFAQFFIAPLFSKGYVNRERQAVNSEYSAKYKDSYRRQQDAFRQIMNPDHPLSKFSVGSLETLADRDDDLVRDDLLDFYQRYYSAHRMTLVVLGRESLQYLQEMVVAKFHEVEKRQAAPLISEKKLFEDGFLPARLTVVPVKESRSLTLLFPVPAADGFYREKPLQYLGNILGHEGKGSLLSLLKEQGWAEGLSAGGGFGGRNEGSFVITVQLTPKGLANKDKVAAAVFEMIGMIRDQGIDSWRFEEQRRLSDIAFRFAEKGEPIHAVSRLASNLHRYAPEHVLVGGYLHEEFKPRLIQRYLNLLTTDNVLWMVTDPKAEMQQVSPNYQTPYRVEPLKKQNTSLSQALSRQMHLPEVNQFVPKRLKMKQGLAVGHGIDFGLGLKVLRFQAPMELWHQRDTLFDIPKAHIFIRVKSPLVGQSAKMAAQMHLFAALSNDTLNEFSYPASLAGLYYGVSANSRGFDIGLSGYNDRQGLLLTRILSVLHKGRFTSERFHALKEELLRKWRNAAQKTPYQQLFGIIPGTLYSPYWNEQQLAAGLESLTFKEFKLFAGRVLQGTELQMLVYGNMFEQEAIKLGALVEGKLYQAPRTAMEMPKAKVVKLDNEYQRQWPVSHRDSAVAFYLQGAGDSVVDEAISVVLRQSLKSSFFHELRTERQLGYVVFVTGMGLKSVPGTLFVVQSPSTTREEVAIEIKSYLKRVIERTASGHGSEFAKHKQAVLSRLKEAPKNLREQAERHWQEIIDSRQGFHHRQQLIDAVAALTEESFSDALTTLLEADKGLWFVTAAAPAADSVAEHGNTDSVDGVEDAVIGSSPLERAVLIEDVDQFKGDRGVYIYR